MPLIGGRIVEGFANGFTFNNLAQMLRQEPLRLDTLKGYAKLTYQSLDIGSNMQTAEPRKYLMRQGNRAIGMCIVAGLMRRKDVKQPGRYFRFTMEPGPSYAIRYYSTFDGESRPHVWPALPTSATRVPNGIPRHSRRRNNCLFTISPDERNYMGAVLLGMSNTEIADKKLSASTRFQMKHACMDTGFKTIAQLSAYCAVNDLIGIPEEVLSPQQNIEPIRYDRPAILELPPLPHGIVARLA